MTGGIETAKLDWEAAAPRSVFFGDVYFSGDGAAETRHVFIGGNDLPRRFENASRFVVGELGFGTGLNILVALDLWRRVKKPGARLDFVSFEKHPLSPNDFARSHDAWPHFVDLAARMRASYPPPAQGLHRLPLGDDAFLTLVVGDAREFLPRVDAAVDAWFLDGFAPSKNPDLWTPEIFAEIARLSAPGATAATFTVAGAVRRGLAGAGFTVEKRAGFGRKKEMLAARLACAQPRTPRAPWFDPENLATMKPGASVGIIGGGVAGASLAHEAHAAGLRATLIDEAGLASGASGNVAGLVTPRLDLGDGAPTLFFRSAYLHALATIARLRPEGDDFFSACGVLLKATTKDDEERHRRIIEARLLPAGWIERRDDGLFFPQAGVVDPKRYCALLAEGVDIMRARAVALRRNANGVEIELATRERLSFDAVVLANGCDALRFVETRTLPLSGMMGQIEHFPDAPAPRHAIAFGPYAAPGPKGGIVIGATYEKIEARATATATRAATLSNIEAVGAVLPEFSTLDPAASLPRAAVRCQTPDRLPVAGAVPDWDYFGASYDDLRFGRTRDYARAHVFPNVFILSGLGSRGLVTAPLCAAYVIAQMTGAPFPVERAVADAINPARFFIRDLRRARMKELKAGRTDCP
jgi:tRNA 5-methylaminomethyl-2-thiouridine biosynthesis bifunctional protein